MATQPGLTQMVKSAVGKPEILNLKALRRLLLRIADYLEQADETLRQDSNRSLTGELDGTEPRKKGKKKTTDGAGKKEPKQKSKKGEAKSDAKTKGPRTQLHKSYTYKHGDKDSQKEDPEEEETGEEEDKEKTEGQRKKKKTKKDQVPRGSVGSLEGTDLGSKVNSKSTVGSKDSLKDSRVGSKNASDETVASEKKRRKSSSEETDESESDDEEEETNESSDYYFSTTDSLRDFETLAKRIQILEDRVLGKALETSPEDSKKTEGKAEPGPFFGNIKAMLDTSSAQEPERANDILKEAITKMQEEFSRAIGIIQNDMVRVKEQLAILPSPAELYNSFFPSWKMLEDALSIHKLLRNNIQNIKNNLGKEHVSGVHKQMLKFLGSKGPSETVLTFLEDLAKLVVNSKHQGAGLPVTRKVSPATIQKKNSFNQYGQGQTLGASVSSGEEVYEQQGAEYPTTSDTADNTFLTYKLARLVEDVIGLRNALTDMQTSFERVRIAEEAIRNLEQAIVNMKKEQSVKSDRDHEVLGNIQMDLQEMQIELMGQMCDRRNEAQRAEIIQFRETLQDYRPNSDNPSVYIDREARIRAQQLQMQVNALHHIVAELQQKLPDVQPGAVPMGMPEDVQHPWGMGRGGPGTNMRAGGGINASPVSPPMIIKGRGITSNTPSPSPPPTTSVYKMSEDRPSPLGGREEKTSQGRSSPAVDKTVLNVDSATFPVRPGLTKKEQEERAAMQQSITKLSTANSLMSAKLEACCNQQAAEIRRLQDLMTRLHRENMNRHTEVQVQLSHLMGDEYEHPSEEEHQALQAITEDGHKSPEVLSTQLIDSPLGSPSGSKPPSAGSKPPSARGCRSRSRNSQSNSASMVNGMITALRKEMLGHVAELHILIKRVEEQVPYSISTLPELDPAAVKKPLVQRYQCLSCDKRVLISPKQGEGPAPLSLPELPKISALTSPPRLRNAATRSNRVNTLDGYEVPRSCGGSYTSSTKPRRPVYYNNLGEVIDIIEDPVEVKRIDVKGTDGHIYKGRLTKYGYKYNLSNNFDKDDGSNNDFVLPKFD